ncbi:phage regulatory CII family protein, partial [Mesorhizobium sp.]|uniref:phage regulatory CII family protein n=1 Tax=Mesorhizobium sp. TaxID=1871066 RepID=UPI00345DEFA7
CGQPIVTAALAEVNGRRLADPDAETVNQGTVMARHADAIIQAGELMAAGAAAFADGKVTPNEATTIDRAAAQLERGLSQYRQALAGIRAAGGLKVVGGE